MPLPSSGKGFTKLWTKVETIVNEHFSAKKITLPGFTVAVTYQGRLLLTAGFGYADFEQKKPMLPNHRTMIGSLTKATITGPTGFKMLRNEKQESTRTLYGDAGVFGHKYDADLQLGTRRFTPIAAIAIDTENQIHAWYTDRTVSLGAPADLDQRGKPVPYVLPAGLQPVDIRSIAFDSKGNAHAWYDTGAYSVGTRADLGAFYFQRAPVDDGDKRIVLPKGKSMLDVVGIGIAKSNDRVYAWYEDSTVSSGTPTDFSVEAPRPFDPGVGKKAHMIRDVEIATNNHVYAWFLDGEASSGMTDNLDRYLPAYRYTWPARPNAPDWQKWYADLTIQNLLDHTSGFVRDGSLPFTAKMFAGGDEDKATYEQFHRHFLRTRKLHTPPGKTEHYSNHNFGLWTLLIEAITGKSYKDYVQTFHLGPQGLSDDVVPHTGLSGPSDAREHRAAANGQWVVFDREQSPLGLAAGGWRASAESVARIMADLDGDFLDLDLDSMGWKKKGPQLWHDGATDGGRSFAAMYLTGHVVGGVDISRVHVAVAANTKGAGELPELAYAIAQAVPGAGVPLSYDLWAPPVKGQ